MVRPHRNLLRRLCQMRPQVVGVLLTALGVCFGSTDASAQKPPLHFQHGGVLSPGAIGRQQLLRGGPLAGYVQPVEITAPEGALVSLAEDGSFERPVATPRKVGLHIAPVYRLKVTNIPRHEGEEVFPTLEVIDRLYPPAGAETRFPIPIQLTQEELELALSGAFVTRVIYLEDPQMALPHAEVNGEQIWMQVGSDEDPLVAADERGRPVAILRLGGRVPDANGPDDTFLFGSPPWVQYAETIEGADVQSARATAAPALNRDLLSR
jgi:hypothetical protein